jgi:lipopolysaccharide/colanic/teichoic acid biosynthesis glycosyltransferase
VNNDRFSTTQPLAPLAPHRDWIGVAARGVASADADRATATDRRPISRHPKATEVKRRPAIETGYPDAVPRQAKRRRLHHWRIAPAGNRSPWYLAAKRALDLVGTVALVIALSPLLLVVFVVLMVTTKGKPIFGQERIGFLGRPFRVYKFRTMVFNAEKLRHTVENQQSGPIFKNRVDPRMTRFGYILRRTSIDELPQLFNVLRGEMSLIGPRPMVPWEVAEFEPWQRKRLAVQPGLTCLWQVSGRSEIGFHRWMLMDLWYVRHQGLLTDIMLLLRTPRAVLSRRGAY